MTSQLKKFKDDQKGAVAVIFALMSVPLIGAVGLTVEYSYATTIQNTMQTAIDDAILIAAYQGPNRPTARWVEHANKIVRSNYNRTVSFEHEDKEDWLNNLDTELEWEDENNINIRMSADIPLVFAKIIPGVPNSWRVTARASAQLVEPQYIYQEPEVLDLDYEAGDYNRIYAYCYNRYTHERTQEVAIADNGGTEFTFSMPRCEAGEALSYRLYNVRMMRTNPARWDDRLAEHYNYYSDTIIVNDVETYQFEWDILETVLCNNLEECKPKSQGGIIPEGRERIPQHNTQACAPGKYMYYGWEDRPPGRGWTDRDYDDIRIIVGCPEVVVDGERRVRLTR